MSADFTFAALLGRRFHITDNTPPNDPLLAYVDNNTPYQWGPGRTQTLAAWHLWQPKNTKPIVIAIVDTGVEDTHPDLKNMMYRDATGAVIGFNALTKAAGATGDDFGHGTHCAGIAAAEGNNGIGVVGIAGWNGNANTSGASAVKIMPVKVLDATGSGDDQGVADGIDWAVAHGANLISLSLGDKMDSAPIAASIARAWNAGLLIICAAGNEGNTNYFYPAADPYSVSVAATTNSYTDEIPYWSTTGAWVNLAAPGENIYSTVPGGAYGLKSGTSMACPCTVGLAALVWAQNPTLKNSEVYQAIRKTVDAYPAYYQRIEAGSGRINSNTALMAVNAAMGRVSGSVTLEGCQNANQAVNFRFRSTDGAMDFTCAANLTAAAGADTGTFTLSNIPAAAYTVSVKGAKWLRKNVSVTVSNAPAAAAALTVRLLAGDSNNDNSVDSADFTALIGAFNSDATFAGSGYDPTADFNCDGHVDSSDFTLLIGNFNQVGEE